MRLGGQLGGSGGGGLIERQGREQGVLPVGGEDKAESGKRESEKAETWKVTGDGWQVAGSGKRKPNQAANEG